MKKIHKPTYLFVDLFLLILSFYVVLDWFPLSTKTPFEKYSWPSFFYITVWLISSYLLGRYKELRTQKYFISTLRLLDTCLIVLVVFKLLIYFYFTNYSSYVLLSISVGVFLLNYLALSIYYAYRYAVTYNEYTNHPVKERINAHVVPVNKLDNECYKQLCNVIKLHSSQNVLNFLIKTVDLQSGNTLTFVSADNVNLQMNPKYYYSTIIQLERLNNSRGINNMLTIINEKLPDNGVFVCCFESKSTYKSRMLKSYVNGFNYVVYAFDFLFRRVLPKIFITRKLFYFFTGGKNRIFSKTEVIGRLYCFGYNVILEKKIDGLTYIFAERVRQPEPYQNRIYGPLIRLNRYGKDGLAFKVYKMRTMHPYSEYLQSYIYERNSLKEGGKFNRDYRVTTAGAIMRKYWLDELPMIINLLRGEMKIVGVRPLSAHYFSLYSKELQKKRIKFKPGLLPPFYADMPVTLEDIQASEMHYLNSCEKNGVLFTDIRYFFLILKNIFFNKARSA